MEIQNGNTQKSEAAAVEVQFRDGAEAPQANTPGPYQVRAPGSKALVYNINENAGLALLLAEMCERQGFHDQAAAIRGGSVPNTLKDRFVRASNSQIRVKHVVITVTVGVAVFLAYEGIAVALDWPRAGVFKSSTGDVDLVKELKGARRAA